MSEHEYLSTQEFADRVGLTYQAIYKRLDTNLKSYVKEVQGKKVLNIQALEQFNMPIPEEFQKKEELAPSPTESLDLLIGMLNSQLETLNSQLEMKDKQISEKDKQLSEKDKFLSDMNERLKETVNVLQTQQNIAQIEQRLKLPQVYNMENDNYEEINEEENVKEVEKKVKKVKEVEKEVKGIEDNSFIKWVKSVFHA